MIDDDDVRLEILDTAGQVRSYLDLLTHIGVYTSHTRREGRERGGRGGGRAEAQGEIDGLMKDNV